MSTVRRHAAGEGKPSVRVYVMGADWVTMGLDVVRHLQVGGSCLSRASTRDTVHGGGSPRPRPTLCDTTAATRRRTRTHCDTTATTRPRASTTATQRPTSSPQPQDPTNHCDPKHPTRRTARTHCDTTATTPRRASTTATQPPRADPDHSTPPTIATQSTQHAEPPEPIATQPP